jgi:hypothetical protein
LWLLLGVHALEKLRLHETPKFDMSEMSQRELVLG